MTRDKYDRNDEIMQDDVCDDTLENDEAVTELMDLEKHPHINIHSWQVNALWVSVFGIFKFQKMTSTEEI